MRFPRERFKTQTAREQALREQSNYATRIWFDKMHGRNPTAPPSYDYQTPWGQTLIAARKQDLPSLEVMASCSGVTKNLYAFAYRGESGSVHSAAAYWVPMQRGSRPFPRRSCFTTF